MFLSYRLPALLACCLMVFSVGFSSASEHKAEAPHFIVHVANDPSKGEEPNGDQTQISMPLKSTEADIEITGFIADVVIRQVYENTGNQVLEADYVFPGSTRSAMYGMQMQIGDRTIQAEIKEREQAKADFEEAKSEGKTASLLEQHRPNVFQMRVGNILPGDRIVVEIRYTETIPAENGIYEFVFPTDVGERYANDEMAQKDPWVTNPHVVSPEHGGHAKTPPFSANINLTAGVAINGLKSPSHAISADFHGKKHATLALGGSQFSSGKDFVLHYQLKDKKIESGLLLFEGEDENFFLYTAQPPDRVTLNDIPEREYIFIVDVSGSMNGFPIEISKKVMKNLLQGLRPEETFNVLLFAGTSAQIFDTPVEASKANIDKALSMISDETGSGSTELLPALEQALAMSSSEQRSKSLVIVTDGYITVEAEAFELVAKKRGEANFFAFGIGGSVNRHLIEGLAHVGRTDPLIVLNETEAKEKVKLFQSYLSSPVLTDIQVQADGFEVYDTDLTVPDLFAQKPITIVGKYKGTPGGSIKLTGTYGKNKPFALDLAVAEYQPSEQNKSLRQLWARQKIKGLTDFQHITRSTNADLVQEITDIGLKYSILTSYTAFIAIDSESRVVDTNWPDNAGATPEPHEWLLILLVFGTLGFLLYKHLRPRFS